MKKLCVIGTGSQARYIIENLNYNKEYNIVGLVDIEKKENVGKKRNNIEIKCILKDINKNFDNKKYEVIVAYGNNVKKKEIVEFLILNNYKFATIINPNSYISSYVEIGYGSIINQNVTIMPNTKIGNHVIIHSGSVIGHDNIIEDFINIGPGVNTSGYVKIEEGSYIYTGATIIPKIKIGKWSIVGAGSVVIRDVKENEVVAGNPARRIKIKEQNC